MTPVTASNSVSSRHPNSNSAVSGSNSAASGSNSAANGSNSAAPSATKAATAAAAKPAAVQVSFADLKLASPLLEALRADGYEMPTPIQAQAIPPLLANRDLLGIAQTGTGKTAAFALPILNHLLEDLTPGVRPIIGRRPKVLVLAPTRELAAQIAESFASYGRHTPLRHAVIFGGVGQGPQVRAIQQGIDILVATPGRLTDLLQQRLVNLSEVSCFVLDEADRMLDMGFIEPIRRISALLSKSRQTMLFSATMPKEIRVLADSLLKNPLTVTVTPVSSAVDVIDQKLYFVLKAQKTQLLIHLFATLDMKRTIVFTKTKHGADRLTKKLISSGIPSAAIHGNKAQNQRTRALDAFRSGRTPVLVATDVAARGLDVDDITHVINFDQPMEPEAYVHRIGRTARAGKSGHAIAFCDVEERDLLKQVERLIKFEIPRERVPLDLPKSDEAAAKSIIATGMYGHTSLGAHDDSMQSRSTQETRGGSGTRSNHVGGQGRSQGQGHGRPQGARRSDANPTQGTPPQRPSRGNSNAPTRGDARGSGGNTAGQSQSHGQSHVHGSRADSNHARPQHGPTSGGGHAAPRPLGGGFGKSPVKRAGGGGGKRPNH